MDRQIFRKNSVIFREGDEADCMYTVYSGSVGVYADYGTAQQKLLKEYGQDCFFGEMGLLEHTVRSATAVALADNTVVESVTEESFGEYFRRSPAQILMIMQQLSGNLRRTSREYAEVCREIQALVEKEEQK